MSITVTTDVFCDGTTPSGRRCTQWTHGVTGGRQAEIKLARQEAKRAGWKVGRDGDFCPVCAGRWPNA